MHQKRMCGPVILAAVLLSGHAFAQHASPCFNLIDQVEKQGLAISAGQDRISKIIESDVGVPERRRAAACQTARGLIGQADRLTAFAEERRSRCETPPEQAALDAAISLGSAKIARSLATVYCSP